MNAGLWIAGITVTLAAITLIAMMIGINNGENERRARSNAYFAARFALLKTAPAVNATVVSMAQSGEAPLFVSHHGRIVTQHALWELRYLTADGQSATLTTPVPPQAMAAIGPKQPIVVRLGKSNLPGEAVVDFDAMGFVLRDPPWNGEAI